MDCVGSAGDRVRRPGPQGCRWPTRPRDEIHFELSNEGSETSLRFTLLTPDDPPDASKAGHIRRRVNHLLFADLRSAYGQ